MVDDINKKACSIELYLPDDLLKKNDKYLPIEWESRKNFKTEHGCETSLYQGVISKKEEVKQNFHKLRKEIESGRREFIPEDWARMRQLLDTIIFAFAKP